MKTFGVSDVELGNDVLPLGELKDNLEALTGAPIEACRSNLGRLSTPIAHPLVEAALKAFAWHLPLTLSPDDVWLCLAQGFATHVRLNAEVLRGRFVSHQGKAEVVLRRDDFVPGSTANEWPGVLTELSRQLAAHVGKTRDLVVANFSTTGPVERAAYEAVLLAAMGAYFDVTMLTKCGVPSITLLGTPADWRALRDRARSLAEFKLERWLRALEPILDQFVAAAEGTVDTEFWQSFVKETDSSGGPYVTGWINVLFPYLEDGGAPEPNPLLARWAKWATRPRGAHRSNGPRLGPALEHFPRGYSVASFTWNHLDTDLPMDFLGGFVGLSQDEHTLALRPAIGWAVRRRP
jgi:hypothetical protein